MASALGDAVAAIEAATRALTTALGVFQTKLQNIPPPNLPPTVEISGPLEVTVGDDLHYIAVATDPESDTITGYTWFIGGAPVGTGNTFHYVPSAAGPIALSVMVTETAGHYTTRGIGITVKAKPVNQAPTVSIAGPVSATVGQSFTYTATASDPDGTIVAYEWTIGSTIVPGSNAASLVYLFNEAGATVISVKVTDNAGATSTSAITVAVAPAVGATAGVRVSLANIGQRSDYVVPTGPNVIVLKPIDVIQTKIDAAPEGAVFVFSAGTYTLPGSGSNDSGLRPKQGQQFHGAPGSKITRLIGTNPGRGKAFIANAAQGNVLLKNLRIEDMVQGNNAETAAVTSLEAPGGYNTQPGGPSRTGGKGWTIENCTITRCSAGIHAGTGTIVQDTDTSACYGVGIKTWGEDVLIRRCRSNGCNMVQEPGKAVAMIWGGSYDTYYEAGGIKLWKGAGCIVEDVEANVNGGSGIWSDYGNAERYRPDTTQPLRYSFRVIRYCTTKANRNSGIAVEMSDRSEVAYNLVEDNLDFDGGQLGRKPATSDWIGGGISVYNSPGVWVHHNTVRNNDGAIVLQFRPRGPIGWSAQPEQAPGPNVGVLGSVAGAIIEDNIFQWTRGKMGLRQIPDDDFPPYTHHDKAYMAPYWAGTVWRRNTLTCVDGLSSSLTDKTNPFQVPSVARTEWDFDYLTRAAWTASGRG